MGGAARRVLSVAGLTVDICLPPGVDGNRLACGVRELTAAHGPAADLFRARAFDVIDAFCRELNASTFQDDLARLAEVVTKLEANTHQLVFFGSGLRAFANQAVAQFTGWSIPGVGEPGQRLRPRTRLYDTADADTLRQVVETLSFERAGLVFIADCDCPTALRQAETVLPAAQRALAQEALAGRLALLQPQDVSGQEPQLAEMIGAAGGDVVTLHDTGGLVSCLSLSAGLARGLDIEALRDGALSLGEALKTPADEGVLSGLSWAALSIARAAEAGPRAVVGVETISVALSDRLGRLPAFAAGVWNKALGAVTAPAAPHDRQPRVRMLAGPQAMRGQDLELLGFGISGPCAVDVIGVQLPEAIGCDWPALGHCVRRLSLQGFEPRALGAVMALAVLEARICAACVDMTAAE